MTRTRYAIEHSSMRSHPRAVHPRECFLGTSISLGTLFGVVLVDDVFSGG
jgi:hypothetical protein